MSRIPPCVGYRLLAVPSGRVGTCSFSLPPLAALARDNGLTQTSPRLLPGLGSPLRWGPFRLLISTGCWFSMSNHAVWQVFPSFSCDAKSKNIQC